jgi:hypothetical protein
MSEAAKRRRPPACIWAVVDVDGDIVDLSGILASRVLHNVNRGYWFFVRCVEAR